MKVINLFRAALCLLVLAGAMPAWAQTQVVMLGTGTPVPDADRAGQSFAVVHDGEAYVFDLGGGAVQNAIKADQDMGIAALDPTRIRYLFFTHLHSDHILDYPEFLATYWWRRKARAHVYGPPGTQQMSDGVYEMLAPDLKARFSGNQPIKDKQGYKAQVTEISSGGTVLDKPGIRIDAFPVKHGSLAHAFGYKIVTPDKTIVISGDTTYDPDVAQQAEGADILIHEAISEQGLSKLPPFWQDYHHAAHTTSSDVARIANAAKPKLLVLVHNLFYGADERSTLDEVRADYHGRVVLADDLDVY
ncbi:MBL fold metallo-hydrolase [Salinisphaera aquimarina]|uniref:MBL fold metallo-hydrolase n=1 Tax=Salinisphaera aquimarina TaxID=2094031 RepID=A0ABV7EN72_9GAMM